jgi:hypothetical protein
MNELVSFLGTSSLTGVFAGAFIDDDDEPKQARLLLQCIYLKFADHLLRCSSIGQFDQLALELVSSVDPAASSSDARLFEDYQFCLVPLMNLFVSEALSSHPIIGIRCFVDTRADAERGIVSVAAMFLENGETLFLDPRNTFGVRIGNRRDLDELVRLNTEGNSDYREFTWNRSD